MIVIDALVNTDELFSLKIFFLKKSETSTGAEQTLTLDSGLFEAISAQ
ncbi:MAG: hypothetical protein IPG78_12290 [Ignavibacteria bacterium]|nr:hypothetical protein [Ignavibacteria bacterium]